MSNIKIHFVISPSEYAQEFGKQCIQKWGQTHILQANYVVSLGGDGTSLLAQQEALSNYLLTGQMLPVYNIDCSDAQEHVGALTNRKVQKVADIEESIYDAKKKYIYPLQADCELLQEEQGKIYHTYYGFNEITVKVRNYEATYLDVEVEQYQNEQPEKMQIKGDGFVLSTPTGMRGYYYSLGGKDFLSDELGFQTIASRENINCVFPENIKMNVCVRSKHRPTCIMRDCNLISSPIVRAKIHKSQIPLTLLKDRQKE